MPADPNPSNRRNEAVKLRKSIADSLPTHPSHQAVSDPSLFGNFWKGLPHLPNGLLSSTGDYDAFADACDGLTIAAFNDTSAVKIGTPEGEFRRWESPTSGAFYELEGFDPQGVTMPPAPALDSAELALEMAEIYLMAVFRDVSFTDYVGDPEIEAAACALEAFRSAHSILREPITSQTLFRGEKNGVTDGPLISQFLLVGTTELVEKNELGQTVIEDGEKSGLIEYGAQQINQKVPEARKRWDYMLNLDTWLHAQNGYDIPNIDRDSFLNGKRFITSARDISTYVHFDALYQAYLNACLILWAKGTKPQATFPHEGSGRTKGFAQFGGPHILTLVTEVATRALKAVRYQKFTNHRRGRPEQLAGLISQYLAGESGFDPIRPLVEFLETIVPTSGKDAGRSVLEIVNRYNKGSRTGEDRRRKGDGHFLPMAFPEGSPMHPSYGAGHATVAGACVTALKAFFDTSGTLDRIYVPNKSGKRLEQIPGSLSIVGELNKLAANISVGRNMAGVHYYTDYTESLKMGEAITIQILQEQIETYTEEVEMTIPTFFGSPGSPVVIKNF